MIVTVRYTPRLFMRGLTASFKDKPVIHGMIFVMLALLLFVSTGMTTTLITLGVIAGLGALAVLLTGLYYAIAFRSKKKCVPLTYRLTDSAIKVTYGDRTSLKRYTRTIHKNEAEKVWFLYGALYVKHKLLIHHIVLPLEKRSEFLEAMRVRGWFERRKLQPSQHLISHSTTVALYILAGLFIFATVPRTPDQSIYLSNEVIVAPLQPINVLTAVNAQRSAFGLPPLQQDQALLAAAEKSCADMSAHKYFGDKDAPTTDDAYTRGYFNNQWMTEVGAAVKSTVGSDAVASKWANNAVTSDAILSGDYTLAGTATCTYTVNNKLATIALIELR